LFAGKRRDIRMSGSEILLIFPKLGSDDIFIKDIPVGLLYAATDVVKNGYKVKLLDLRLYKDWKKALSDNLTDTVKVVGISVYTGYPIKTSLEISKFVKGSTHALVVWGGPHASIEPSHTLENENIDYLVRGYGAAAFGRLADHIFKRGVAIEEISGVSYKVQRKIIHNPVSEDLELIDYRDIPYELVGETMKAYSRFNSGEVFAPIYTSVGCPYQCAFCISPILYRDKKVKWKAYPNEEILSHIKYLRKKFNANHLSIYDDDAFIDLDRIKNLLRMIKTENVNMKISFRGVRVNELDRIDQETLKLLEDVGATHFQVGVESGSDRILGMMQKGITVEQVLRVNRKLSKFDKLVPLYNLMTGIPGETLDELKDTIDIMIKLIDENPGCLVGYPVKFKPYPGSELFDLAVEMGLGRPKRLEDWIKYDSAESDIYFPWYTPRYNHFIKMAQVASYFVDNKAVKEIKGTTIFNRILRFISRIYQPIAYLRLKYKFDKLLIEDCFIKIFRWTVRITGYAGNQ